MSNIVIQVDHLSKRYTLSHQTSERYQSLRDVLVHQTRQFGRRFRLKKKPMINTQQEDFWALQDVSFNIRQGERVGIIGRNGAGKSTLLKVLSRITEPTNGRIVARGRVASLLEVGTGFHPELTGRENIFLNGAILGMGRAEIKRKFDEIVAFAEVERFLDTPVKRYSSGMYVRLAFAVAAHLEPEILIVDEVLAVGDVQFQEKCLGKMEEVAGQGRTVLFVSHSMQAISQLTNRCIFMQKGQVKFDGATETAVMEYLSAHKTGSEQPGFYQPTKPQPGNHVAWAKAHTSYEHGVHRWGDAITFEFALNITEPRETLCFSFQILNSLQQPICHYWLFDGQAPFRKQAGMYRVRCQVPKLRLFMGNYTLTTWLSERRGDVMVENLANICPIEVTMQGIQRNEYAWKSGDCVYIEDAFWEMENESLKVIERPIPMLSPPSY